MNTKIAPKLVIQFGGWILMRLATDPDPTDEPRGVSGYTFAFGDEPDLDRVISFQVPAHFKPRSHTFPIGVHVMSAVRKVDRTETPLPALKGAPVDLLGKPRLENRNWTLTPAGFEPIVPFDLVIKGKDITLQRSAPLIEKSNERQKPVWEISESLLEVYSAVGVLYEPATVGNATGIWDSYQVAEDRVKALQKDLDVLKNKKDRTPAEDTEMTIIEARIKELEIGINSPVEQPDRRIGARYYVERFNFNMLGDLFVTGDEQKTLGGKLPRDKAIPWQIGFWIGAWDPDALSAYILGALEIPYAS
jgi:hypothetical protein